MANKPTKKTPTVAEAGRRGGKARAANQTPEKRSESARKAAVVRWTREKELKEWADDLTDALKRM